MPQWRDFLQRLRRLPELPARRLRMCLLVESPTPQPNWRRCSRSGDPLYPGAIAVGCKP